MVISLSLFLLTLFRPRVVYHSMYLLWLSFVLCFEDDGVMVVGVGLC